MMPYNPSSMTLFAADQKEKWNFSFKLRVIQSPHQQGSRECGYYVMRYMNDIIADLSLLMNKFNEKKSYTTTEIDEVQVEWANHLEVWLASSSPDGTTPQWT